MAKCANHFRKTKQADTFTCGRLEREDLNLLVKAKIGSCWHALLHSPTPVVPKPRARAPWIATETSQGSCRNLAKILPPFTMYCSSGGEPQLIVQQVKRVHKRPGRTECLDMNYIQVLVRKDCTKYFFCSSLFQYLWDEGTILTNFLALTQLFQRGMCCILQLAVIDAFSRDCSLTMDLNCAYASAGKLIRIVP